MASIIKRCLYRIRHSLVYSRAMPSMSNNVEYNRELWNRYARIWDKETVFLEKDAHKRAENIEVLGDEWGTPGEVDAIAESFIYPYVNTNVTALEIGVGGGRIARRVAPRVKMLHAFDISPQMLAKAGDSLKEYGNIQFHLLESPSLPEEFTNSIDFAYSFDVFVHLDIHTMWKYFREIFRVLKPGGHAFLHTSNLASPGGWEHFSSQSTYNVSNHYFICPQIIDILADKAKLLIVKNSQHDPSNFYLHRDFLFVMRKEAQVSADS